MEPARVERWKDRVALVTGASSGIGKATARMLLSAGLRVYGSSRSSASAEALRREMGDAFTPLTLDVAREDSVLVALQTIREREGALHVLVNNAGLGHEASLLEGDTAQWREMLDVNVLGLCIVTREGVRLMREGFAEGREHVDGNEGHVFHLGSLSGHRIPPGSNVYGATKFAVRALTESLRQEIHAAGLPIRVSCISPGFVETNFHERHFKDAERARQLYRTYKVLEPRDVAQAIGYALFSPPHVQVHDILVRPRAQGS